MEKSVIVAAVRTPIGSFQGCLAPLKATDLGAVVIHEALVRAGIDGKKVDEVIMGCVLTAGLGQNPARQAAIGAGIAEDVGAFTVNKVCSSGLLAVILADELIRLGEREIVVAGGMESMTNAPYILPNARGGMRLGDSKAVDSMVFDGLWDIHTNQHMGSCAEMCAEKYGFTRKMQDEFAAASYKKALGAIESGAFKGEIIGVEVAQKKGGAKIFDTDEEPARVNFDKMATLKPSFIKDGTVTAANASSISDGAAALVVMSESWAKKQRITPMCQIVAHATHSHAPEWFTTAPIGAIKKVLEKANLSADDIDIFEINEAFSPVTMAAIKEFNLDESKVNVSGGAVALGHPIGASGARILVTLLYAMKRLDKKTGLAVLCNGGGEATAMIVKM
ncbi:MAG: acetyl-CoA C-acetyltransferase [Pseudomonadota bacterium]